MFEYSDAFLLDSDFGQMKQRCLLNKKEKEQEKEKQTAPYQQVATRLESRKWESIYVTFR